MSIKLDRACKLAKMLSRAEAEILSSIPAELSNRLTSAELALVMKALNGHWHKALAFKERDILAEGCVWDDAAQKMREISQ
jgi:hypothetical protein